MSQPDRRRDSRPVPSQDRRRGDRRAGQAAVLHHRRATDRRVDAAGAALVLQRSAFRSRVVAEPVVAGSVGATAVLDLVQAEEVVVDLPALEAAPVVDVVRCPFCEVLHDRLWLIAHVARDHPTGR